MTAAPDSAPGTPESARTEADLAAPTPRELRRARELETRRREVLDAAEALFAAHGYEGTSLERIAAESGHSVGAIYNLFSNKDGVFAAVLEQPTRLLVSHLAECVAAQDTGMSKVLAMASTAVNDMRAFPPYARASFATPVPLGSSSYQRESAAAMLNLYAEALRAGQADGSVRTGDPVDLARYLGGLISAHIHVDPRIAGRRAGTSLEDFIDIVRSALSPPGS